MIGTCRACQHGKSRKACKITSRRHDQRVKCSSTVLTHVDAFVQVAHVVEEVDFLQKDCDGVIQGSWAEKQIRTSADFCHGSFFWTHFSGGLNYQIVHHLFPGVIHTHYPALAPIVQKVAQKHGLPYIVFPTFYSAFASHFNHLKSTGLQLPIPSMHTIG